MISVAVSKFSHAAAQRRNDQSAAPLRRRVKTFFDDTRDSLTWFQWRCFYVEG